MSCCITKTAKLTVPVGNSSH